MTKFAIGFITGLFIGWVIGILSAPQSGKDTLDSIGERAIELRDRAVSKAEHVREDLAPEA
jgi:gas vesicle protein